MSALGEIYIKKETLKNLFDVVSKKGENGVSLTISINDETNDYGQNISAFVSQSKEDREAQKPKFYTGNGKIFWTNGEIKVAEKKDKAIAATPMTNIDDDILPF